MYLLGFDIGSSSVKVSLIEGDNGNCVASSFYPKQEMKITAHRAGWAEQEPELVVDKPETGVNRCSERIKS